MKSKEIVSDVRWVGADNRRLDLFENLYPLRRGVSFNSYLLLGDKTALIDSADRSVTDVFFERLADALGDRGLDYLVIEHLEPDHAANLIRVADAHPNARLVMNAKTVVIFERFFGKAYSKRYQIVGEGDELDLGGKTLKFFLAPMVHWPEVMVVYEETEKILFSADAFGTFGALNGKLTDEHMDFAADWVPEARRYYCNIVGKYGNPVQMLLKKLAGAEIRAVCPLHGPVLKAHIADAVELYRKWSAYEPEDEGALIAYASMYGNTERAAEEFAFELAERGVNAELYDLSRTDPSVAVAEAFRFRHIALFAPTYNASLYPAVETFLAELRMLGLKNRRWILAENGSWAPTANAAAEKAFAGLVVPFERLTIQSVPREEDFRRLAEIAGLVAKGE